MEESHPVLDLQVQGEAFVVGGAQPFSFYP